MRPKEEEVVNAVSHLFAAFVSFFITMLLVIKSPGATSLPIFILGSTASWTFFCSFLYHGSFKEPRRSRNRSVDIAGIYIMIAGSGISACLVSSLSIHTILSCFIIFIAACALILKFCLDRHLPEAFIVSSCVLLSWLSILPATGLFWPTRLAENNVILLFLLGGVVYSIGIVFYILDTKKWYHTGWHVCVMLGFSCHYLAECIALGLVQ